jgi:hypothetical protein
MNMYLMGLLSSGGAVRRFQAYDEWERAMSTHPIVLFLAQGRPAAAGHGV